MSRTEQIVSVAVLCVLILANIFTVYATSVPAAAPAVSQQSGSVGVRDAGTPGLMTSTPAATATIAPTATPITGESLGASQGGIRFGYTSAYTSGVNLLHGLGTTPKGCVVTFISSSAVTVTAMAFSTTVFSMTTSSSNVPMYWSCGL